MSIGLPVVAFVGPPGSGKSTQAELFAQASERGSESSVIASVPALLRQDVVLLPRLRPSERKAIDALRDEAEEQASVGLLMPAGLDRVLLDVVERISATRPVLLDGLPRGVQQARMLLDSVLSARLTVIHLELPGDVQAASMRRQRQRALGRQTSLDPTALRRMAGKVRTYQDETLPGLTLLRHAGVPVCACDAEAPPAETAERVRQHLAGRGVRALPMQDTPLSVSSRTEVLLRCS
ncbi:hypothetical protein GCM10010201_34160 [Pilimelia columellifera subsp. columellifera]|uniref:Adenylate kinase n=1 Tax=Pilimelia columellifera subsp. columellifera TaxID=706583 RepID=A0ABN3NTH6_9ACTN